ncbi:MAG: hypothetical protein ACKV2Q_09590 [Planctomycetaceae bacterium]
MACIGLNIGKSRLAEVVSAVNLLRAASARNVDVFYGVRLSECDIPRLEAIHYDWASCCDRRLFAVVAPGDEALIRRLGVLGQMFDLFVLTQANDTLSEAINVVNPRADVRMLGKIVVGSPESIAYGDKMPIAVDCVAEDGTFSLSRAAEFIAAAAKIATATTFADDRPMEPGEAATDVAPVKIDELDEVVG